MGSSGRCCSAVVSLDQDGLEHRGHHRGPEKVEPAAPIAIVELACGDEEQRNSEEAQDVGSPGWPCVEVTPAGRNSPRAGSTDQSQRGTGEKDNGGGWG
jgi:hypothetical protein